MPNPCNMSRAIRVPTQSLRVDVTVALNGWAAQHIQVSGFYCRCWIVSLVLYRIEIFVRRPSLEMIRALKRPVICGPYEGPNYIISFSLRLNAKGAIPEPLYEPFCSVQYVWCKLPFEISSKKVLFYPTVCSMQCLSESTCVFPFDKPGSDWDRHAQHSSARFYPQRPADLCTL